MSANHMFWSAGLFLRRWLPNIWTDNNINSSLLWFAPRLAISVHLQFHRWNSIRLPSCEFPWAAVGATWRRQRAFVTIGNICNFTGFHAGGRRWPLWPGHFFEGQRNVSAGLNGEGGWRDDPLNFFQSFWAADISSFLPPHFQLHNLDG